MIRQTLGYCDADGRPQVQRVSVNYRELEENAGISRGAVGEALDEAVRGNFLRCVRIGSPNLNGKRYTTAEYELRWDEGNEYLKDPKQFKGFFEGEGNRTDIPNQFFDVIIPTESLSVIKVVGSVLRFSVGYQARQGGRRQQASLSYKDLQNWARMGSPRHLSAAIQYAIETGYIVRTADGVFDTDNGKLSKAATYAIKWETTATYGVNGSKREAGVQTGERFKKGSGNAPKREAEERFKKGSDIQTKAINKTSKQQQPEPVAAEDFQSFTALRTAGFDEATARRLAVRSAEIVERQIAWLPRRGAKQNPQGLLRRAIEENWPEPVNQVATSQLSPDSPPSLFAKYFYASLGNNTGEPTAEPSNSDLASAHAYLDRLLADWPNGSLAPKWGTAFGRLGLGRIEGKRPAIISFAAMLRSYGDEFLVRNRHARQNELSTAREATAARQESALRPLWREYVRGCREHAQATRPDEYVAFEAWREEQRKLSAALPGQFFRDKALSYHDSADGLTADFIKFFAKDVLDFRAWVSTQPELTTV